MVLSRSEFRHTLTENSSPGPNVKADSVVNPLGASLIVSFLTPGASLFVPEQDIKHRRMKMLMMIRFTFAFILSHGLLFQNIMSKRGLAFFNMFLKYALVFTCPAYTGTDAFQPEDFQAAFSAMMLPGHIWFGVPRRPSSIRNVSMPASILEAISKMCFGPISTLGDRIKSSKYPTYSSGLIFTAAVS